MSQNTGTPPQCATIAAVATQVKAGTITSSPGFSPSALSATCSAAVPELTATPCAIPLHDATAASNPWHSFPWVSQPLSNTRRTAARSSSSSDTRTMGTGWCSDSIVSV